jgi:acetyl-CoA carboxylase biotin carboxyl carrier protein
MGNNQDADVTKDDAGLIGDLDIRRIVQLVEALDRSKLDTLQLDLGHFRLTLGKAGARIEPSSALKTMPGSSGGTTPKPTPPQPKASSPTPRRPARSSGTVEVRSPIMGIFYSKPDPGSPPFVSVGAKVDEGTTVALIEVMKVFQAVQAGAKGQIVEICVKEAETVAIDQTLFRIRPAKT